MVAHPALVVGREYLLEPYEIPEMACRECGRVPKMSEERLVTFVGYDVPKRGTPESAWCPRCKLAMFPLPAEGFALFFTRESFPLVAPIAYLREVPQ
jgi:hypothetical protein